MKVHPATLYICKQLYLSDEARKEFSIKNLKMTFAQLIGNTRATECFYLDESRIPIFSEDDLLESMAFAFLSPCDFLYEKDGISYFKISIIPNDMEADRRIIFRFTIGVKNNSIRTLIKDNRLVESEKEFLILSETNLLRHGLPCSNFDTLNKLESSVISTSLAESKNKAFVYVTLKANKFTLSEETRTKLSLLGFKYYKAENHWRIKIHTLALRYYRYLLEQLMPKWNDLRLSYFNDSYFDHKKIPANMKSSPINDSLYFIEEESEGVRVDFNSMWKFAKTNNTIENIRIECISDSGNYENSDKYDLNEFLGDPDPNHPDFTGGWGNTEN